MWLFGSLACRLVREGRPPDREVAKGLGVTTESVRLWVKQSDLDAGRRSDGLSSDGISDALHSAEVLAGALDAVLRGEKPWNQALSDDQRWRDAGTEEELRLTLAAASSKTCIAPR